MLEKLIKISSLSGALLIFCGVLKSIIFYNAFSIDIVDFLSFSEIITSFLDDINILLILGGIMFMVSLGTLHYAKYRSGSSMKEFLESVINYYYERRFKYGIFFFLILGILSISTLVKILSLNYIIIYFLIFCFLQFLTIVFLAKDEESKETEIYLPNYLAGLSSLLTIVLAIFLLAQHDIQKVKKSPQSTVVYFKDLKITCNGQTKNLYLGKTDGYVFFYIDSSNSSLTLPISEIQKFEFK